MEQGVMTENVYRTQSSKLTSKEALQILQNHDQSLISQIPPWRPKAGEIYLISSGGDDRRKNDWSHDGYQWVNKGGDGYPRKEKILWRKYYSISTMPTDKIGSSEFQRTSFKLVDNHSIVLVHYTGDENVYVPRPHGNKKSDSGDDFVSTCPSVLSQIKEKVVHASDKPQEVYRSMVTDGNKVSGKYQGVLNPRNAKQIRNIQTKMNKSRRLSHDEIYNTLQLAYHLDNFVHQFSIFPDLQCFVANKELLQELNKILQVKSDEIPLLSYDTTFLIGDFYVSVLVFKHVLFDCNPSIPVAFYIHDRKSEDIHLDFWRKIATLVPNINRASTVLVTDREKAVVNAIKKVVPNAALVHCWNHIHSDAKHWIKQHGGKSDDQLVYISNLKELLQMQNEDDYAEKLEELSQSWSKPFLEYYQSKLHQDIIKHSAKWVLEEHKVYDPYSGVTNNMSESMNAVIKRMMHWKQAPLDATVLAFNYLQTFYVYETMRGLSGVGNYRLKNMHSGAAVDKCDLAFPNDVCAPEKIVDLVKGKMVENEQNGEDKDQAEDLPINATVIDEKKQQSTTQKSLAIAAVKDKRVFHVPEAGSFVVKGSNGDNYSVSLFPEKCQCPSVGSCYHIMAVKMSIGEENIEENRIYNLTQLRRNNRKRVNKKAGTKKPRPCDKDVTVIAAPDSCMKRNGEWSEDILSHMDAFTPVCEKPDGRNSASTTKRKRNDSNSKARKRIKFEDENKIDKEPSGDDMRNPGEEKWVENGKQILTTKHRNDIIKDNMLCSDVINFAQSILKQQFPKINGFQHTGYAPVVKDSNWEYKLQMSPEIAPVAQIHHTGYQHWIASLKMKASENVMILDSSNKKRDYLSQSTQLQLGKMYGKGMKTLNVSILDVQQQTNGVDCGVFAIANLTDFCFSEDIKDQPIPYDIEKMRSHLIKCLEDKKFEKFPKKQNQKKRLSLTRKREFIKQINIDCASGCSLPNVYDNMIACENPSCGQWYHLRCVGIQDPKESLVFMCPSCAD